MAKGKKKYTQEEEKEIYKDIIENSTPRKNTLESVRINVKCKTENQKKLIKSIQNKEVTFCSGPAGTGKAQPLDSKILTPAGFVNMGEIKVGDFVATKNGNFTKVLGVYPQGEKDIYKITFSDGSFTECCLEHLWECSNEKERNCYKRKRVNEKKIIIEKKHDFSIKSTEDIKNELIVRDNRLNYSIPIVKEISFDEEEHIIDPYIMGVLIGDGCFVASNVCFSTCDEEILISFKEFAEKNNLEVKKVIGKHDYRLIGQKNILKYNLLDLGLYGKKSENKFIPKKYLIDSIENRKELLKGLMDSDGYVGKNGNVYFYTVSNKLKDDFLFLIRSLGFLATVTVKNSSYKDKNGIKIFCQKCYCICLNTNSFNPFKIERKSKRFVPRTKYKAARYISSIDFVGKKQAQCIYVEDDSHLYVTDDFILTHNTYLSCAEALMTLKKDPKIKKIILVKSVTTLKEEELGFLKGSLADKMEPVMYSFSGNFEKLLGTELFQTMKIEGLIEERPIAYVRGITIDNSIVIIDEIQNISIDNLRTLLTRIGENSKYILLGDEKQIDLKDKTKSSLKIAMDKFEKIEDFGIVRLGSEDVVRHRLINIIEKVFDEINEEQNPVTKNEKLKSEKKTNHVSLPGLPLEDKQDNI